MLNCNGMVTDDLLMITGNTIHDRNCFAENVLRSIDDNLIDRIWIDRPKRTSNKIITLSTEMTGKTVNEKIEEIRSEMANKGANVLVVTALDEVACE